MEREFHNIPSQLDHRGPDGSMGGIRSDTQAGLANAFAAEQTHRKPNESLAKGITSLIVDKNTSAIPTTLNSLDGSPSDFMEVDFEYPNFQKLYQKADTQYQQQLSLNEGMSEQGALMLRLQIRDQVLQDAFPSDANTMNKYEGVHDQLNNRAAPAQLSDYFTQGSAVCIQRASLTAYYLHQCGIKNNVCIQKLPTADGGEEYHAYISLRDKKLTGNEGLFYDPTNPIKMIDEQGNKHLKSNVCDKAEDLLLYRSKGIQDQISGELAKEFGSNTYAFAA